uniref:Menorin-like domain-containing protein n=1 Tax=Haptolina brevifila TaxID=156173 RepID=A0A7S2NJM5_9EUKA
MAHPTWRKTLPPDIDLTFTDFLERCVRDGTRHLKLDFKELAAVEPCLELLAQHWPQLHSNGQAVWLNADILPGPNARSAVAIPARNFVPLCRQLCPHAVLSLGWCVGPLGPEQVYAEHDVREMLRVCTEHGLPSSAVVFAASLRFSERNPEIMGRLLERLPDAQLLYWSGTGEPPVQPSSQASVHQVMVSKGVSERVGYDLAVANSLQQTCAASVVDCTFFWSRWSRWLCCATTSTPYLAMIPPSMAGERQPLVYSTPPSNSSSEAPTPKRMPSLSNI